MSSDDISLLAGGAHEPLSPFDQEVQRHLNALSGSPQDTEGQQQIARTESIANPVDYGNPPILPGSAPVKPKAPLPTDGRKSLDSAFSDWDPSNTGR